MNFSRKSTSSNSCHHRVKIKATFSTDIRRHSNKHRIYSEVITIIKTKHIYSFFFEYFLAPEEGTNRKNSIKRPIIFFDFQKKKKVMTKNHRSTNVLFPVEFLKFKKQTKIVVRLFRICSYSRCKRRLSSRTNYAFA